MKPDYNQVETDIVYRALSDVNKVKIEDIMRNESANSALDRLLCICAGMQKVLNPTNTMHKDIISIVGQLATDINQFKSYAALDS